MITVAAQAAHKFAARYRMDPVELRQQAYVAVAEAALTFKPERGTPFRAYAWFAARNCLYNYVINARSPVSGRDKKVLQNCREFDGEWDIETEGAQEAGDYARRIRTSLSKALEHANVPDAELGLQVLLGHTSKDVATDAGCDVRRVYTATYALRQALKSDPAMMDLWAAR